MSESGQKKRSVSKIERKLLRIQRGFLSEQFQSGLNDLLRKNNAYPKCLSRDAVELVKQGFKVGAVSYLARQGWRKERFLKQDTPKTERLWKRHLTEQLGLTFSPLSLQFLVWATCEKALETRSRWYNKPTLVERKKLEPTIGDQFFMFRAFYSLRDNREFLDAWAGHKSFQVNGFCLLVQPDAFQDRRNINVDLSSIFEPKGMMVLEALQRVLANRWIDMELLKGTISNPQTMTRLGIIQEKVLNAFFSEIERTQRWDLSRFLLIAAYRLLQPSRDDASWCGKLNFSNVQRISERVEIYDHTFALLRGLRRLQQWAQNARATAHYDEGYKSAQVFLSDWEQFSGDRLYNRAEEIIRTRDPLNGPGNS